MTAGTLSIVISVLAFLVAAANFYFSHLRAKRDLRAIVVDAGHLADTAEVFLDIVFVNSGTQQEVVTGVALDFFYEPRQRVHGFLDISDVMPFMVRPDPLALAPKSKTLKRYRFRLLTDKLEAARANLPPTPGARISCRLKFKVIDADGFTYTRAFSRGSMGRLDCPISFGFVTDDLLPLERDVRDISKLALDKTRFAEYRRFRLHPLAIMRWAYWMMHAPRVECAPRENEKVV
jgi:hypothetical protein